MIGWATVYNDRQFLRCGFCPPNYGQLRTMARWVLLYNGRAYHSICTMHLPAAVQKASK
jgi:hypothetical protein